MGRLMRHFLGGLRTHMIRIFTKKRKTILIHSKEYHITPQYKHLYPSKDDYKLTLKLTSIKKNLGTLAGGNIQEVPMAIMIPKKKLEIIHIEVDK